MNIFNIVKHLGQPNSATYHGRQVHREDKIFIPEWGRFVITSPDDTHFIFENKRKREPAYLCTCGSSAVITGSNAYKEFGSPTPSGEMLVCLAYLTYGRHFTSMRKE